MKTSRRSKFSASLYSAVDLGMVKWLQAYSQLLAKPCSEGQGEERTTPVALKRFTFIIYSHRKAFIVFLLP